MQEKSPTLKELQTWMSKILTAPKGASETINDARPESFERKWLHSIQSDKTSSTKRLDIYAEAYFARILEAFTIDFPISFFAMGEDQFAKFVAEYLKIYPSTEYNLNNISKSVVEFIKTYSSSQAIHDVVTLERLALESFYAPIDKPFDTSTLSFLEEKDWEKIKFSLNSTIRFIKSSWPLETLWDNRDSQEKSKILECESTNYYFLKRVSHHVKLNTVSETEYRILQKLNEGHPLSSFGEDDIKGSSEEISALFANWIQKGLLREFYF